MAGRLKPARPALLLVVAVVLVHGLAVREVAQGMRDLDPAAAMPARIDVAFVRELEPVAPPVVDAAPVAEPPAPVVPPRPPRQASPPKPAASAPEVSPAASAPEPSLVASAPVDAVAAAGAASEPEPPASAPGVVAAASAAEPAPSASAAPDEAPFPVAAASTPEPAASAVAGYEWPASTRITYVLTGNVRGEVHGSAQVDWIRASPRYEVHLDVTVGMKIAPVYSRRMTSAGQLTDAGLAPERYDEESKVPFRDPRRNRIGFEPDTVVLSKGQRVDRLPGVQDSASQFVQMSYLFSRRPQLLQAGAVVEMPLALPRRQSVWIYDVGEQEMIPTPFGPLEALRLKPRRESKKGDDLTADVWFAPGLRYLPVRIRIQQDEETFLDLTIDRKPQLAQ